MRPVLRKIVSILSHPIWNSLTCLITFVVGFGLVGGIVALVYAFLKRLGQLIQFLAEPVPIQRIMVYFTAGLVLFYLATVARSTILRLQERRVPQSPGGAELPRGYCKYWNVLWKPIPKLWEEMLILGPYCPTHLLEMDVKMNNGVYSFRCHGAEGEAPHTLTGPSHQALIPSRESLYSAIEYLQHDVRQRVYAEMRRGGQ